MHLSFSVALPVSKIILILLNNQVLVKILFFLDNYVKLMNRK